MTEQFLDHTSSGFNKLIELMQVTGITIKSNHSNISISNTTQFILLHDEALSDCGKLRFNMKDIQASVARQCPQNNIFLHLFFFDGSSIHLDSSQSQPPISRRHWFRRYDEYR